VSKSDTKKARSGFNEWVEDYTLHHESNFSPETEADCEAAFYAGIDFSVSQQGEAVGTLASAEEKLASAGVFKGSAGLRGLVESQEFWDKQPYGTRLYYGDGIADYLHRDVLRSALSLLDAPHPPADRSTVRVPELNNIRFIDRSSDFSVKVNFTSCRAASAFEKALKAAQGEG
tara:strand:+ start:5304 stop:5825 length:522 start_codon:yes stop_codon:yes gene_type:complete